MTDLHKVIFPEDISYGMSGSWGFNNQYTDSASGKDIVYPGWSQVKHSYTFQDILKNEAALIELKSFYLNRYGEAYRFLFRDWMDCYFGASITELVPLATNPTSTTQLQKRYVDSSGLIYYRTITKAQISTLRFYRSDTASYLASTDYSVVDMDSVTPYGYTDTGIITWTPAVPFATGTIITVSGLFYVPVRFTMDAQNPSYDQYNDINWKNIRIVESGT